MRRDEGCRYLVIAIVRNPLDVVYSAWRRFRYRPEQYQWEWVATYDNLEVASRLFGDRFVQLRYEDLVTGPTDLFDRVADLVGVPASTWEDRGGLHGGSLRRWSTDPGVRVLPAPGCRPLGQVLRLRRGRAAQPAGQPDVAVPPGGAPRASAAARRTARRR